MFKKIITLCMLLVILMPTKAQTNDDAQWDAFQNIIPSYESISFNWSSSYGDGSRNYSCTLRIYSDYSVTLNYEENYVIPLQLEKYVRGNASGNVRWNDDRKNMTIQLIGSASISSTYGINSNVQSEYKDTEFTGSTNINQTILLTYNKDEKKFYINGFEEVTVRVTNFNIGSVLALKNMNYKASTFGKKKAAATLDQFGRWQWNKDRSVIFLKSNTSNSQIQIVRPQKTIRKEWKLADSAYVSQKKKYISQLSDTILYIHTFGDESTEIKDSIQNINDSIRHLNKLKRDKIKHLIVQDSLKMSLVQKYDIPQEKLLFVLKLSDNSSGINQQTTEDGILLDAFELIFDQTSNDGFLNTFLFAKIENGLYKFATYNRFLNEISYEATPIINQIAKKNTISINYRLSNGSNQLDIFMLEGLETIMEYINK